MVVSSTQVVVYISRRRGRRTPRRPNGRGARDRARCVHQRRWRKLPSRRAVSYRQLTTHGTRTAGSAGLPRGGASAPKYSRTTPALQRRRYGPPNAFLARHTPCASRTSTLRHVPRCQTTATACRRSRSPAHHTHTSCPVAIVAPQCRGARAHTIVASHLAEAACSVAHRPRGGRHAYRRQRRTSANAGSALYEGLVQRARPRTARVGFEPPPC